jgi:hypothetical protein
MKSWQASIALLFNKVNLDFYRKANQMWSTAAEKLYIASPKDVWSCFYSKQLNIIAGPVSNVH